VALVRRQPDLCNSCIATMLGVTIERVLEAIQTISRTVTVSQNVSRCTFCGRTRWVLSLSPPPA